MSAPLPQTVAAACEALPQCLPMLGHHMRPGATTSFDGDKDLESGSEADGSLDDAGMSGDEERDESNVPDLRESVKTVKFYAVSIANVPFSPKPIGLCAPLP